VYEGSLNCLIGL